MVDPKKLEDWRIMTALEVAKDAILPGGGQTKAGDIAYVVTVTTDSRHGRVTFVTPGPVLLSLDIAGKAANAAAALRNEVEFERTPGADAKSLVPGHLPRLFEYFAQFMVTVTFSFQCLEVFCNDAISRHPNHVHTKTNRDGVERTLTPEEAEREFSTDDKLARIVPKLFGTNTPKGTALWERYRRLKAMRDTTIHFKSTDQYVRNKADKTSLYHHFLNRDPHEFPRTALEVLRYFVGTDDTTLAVAEQQLFGVER